MLCCTVLFSCVFYCIVLCCFHLYFTVLYCTVLFSFVFYCAVLYCICFRRIQRERGSGVHYRWIADFLRHRLLCSLRSLLPRYGVPTPGPFHTVSQHLVHTVSQHLVRTVSQHLVHPRLAFPCQSLSEGGQTSHVHVLIVTVCQFTNGPFHSVNQKARERIPANHWPCINKSQSKTPSHILHNYVFLTHRPVSVFSLSY